MLVILALRTQIESITALFGCIKPLDGAWSIRRAAEGGDPQWMGGYPQDTLMFGRASPLRG